MHGSERRRAPRVSLGSVDVRLSGVRGSLIGLSMLGAQVSVSSQQTPDSSVLFEMDAAGGALEIRARVVRCICDAAGEQRIALEFEDLSMDALLVLTRLTEQEVEPWGPVVPAAQPSGWWS